MGHYREPESEILATGYVMLALALPVFLGATPAVVLAMISNWWIFGSLADQDRVLAAILFAAMAISAAFALILGVRAISDKHVEGTRPVPVARTTGPLQRHMKKAS